MPTPEDIQRELQRFMKERFGDNVVVGMMPGPAPEHRTAAAERRPPPSDKRRAVLEFRYRPKEVKAYLDRFVIEQEEAKKVLSIAACDHYNHVRRSLSEEGQGSEYVKQNILLLGPTGVGKTYLIRSIARLIGVPFVRADATKFSETGYVGGDVEDLVRELVHMADGDIELAQYGIIYLDEIDKIARSPNMIGRDVSGRGVQTNLLKLMEETDVPLRSPTDLAGQMQELLEMQMRGGRPERKTINTRHVLFIVSGAFAGLSEIVRRRVAQSEIGFNATPRTGTSEDELLRQLSTGDLIEYGFEPEFVGRLPIRVVCSPLAENELYRILRYSEGSILRQYRDAFDAYGIDVAFDDEAMREVARLAAREATGARGLMTVLERVLREFKYELPSARVERLEVTADLVRDPASRLAFLLREAGQREQESCAEQARAFAAGFAQRHGLELRFSAEAIETLWREAQQRGLSAANLCQDLFRDFEFGLKLIAQNTGRRVFELGPAAVTDPARWLSESVRQSYAPPAAASP